MLVKNILWNFLEFILGSILSMEERSWTTIDMENYCEYFGKIHMNGMSVSISITKICTRLKMPVKISWTHGKNHKFVLKQVYF